MQNLFVITGAFQSRGRSYVQVQERAFAVRSNSSFATMLDLISTLRE